MMNRTGSLDELEKLDTYDSRDEESYIRQLHSLSQWHRRGLSTSAAVRERVKRIWRSLTSFSSLDAYSRLAEQSEDKAQPINFGATRGRKHHGKARLHGFRIPWGCCLPLTSLVLEVVVFVLFLALYLRLPMDPDTGERQRIASQYSAWPFISCVGSTTPATYQILSVVTCVFYLLSAGLGFWHTRDLVIGFWLRRAQLVETLISGGLLIWLTFASDDADDHLHITLVALRLLFLFVLKMTSWTVWYLMRKGHSSLQQDHLWITSFWWKTAILFPSLIAAALANVGAFSCDDPEVIQTEGTVCYRLIFGAAVSDWVYTIINVLFLLNLSYDFYHGDHYDKTRRGLSEGDSVPGVEDARMYVGRV